MSRCAFYSFFVSLFFCVWGVGEAKAQTISGVPSDKSAPAVSEPTKRYIITLRPEATTDAAEFVASHNARLQRDLAGLGAARISGRVLKAERVYKKALKGFVARLTAAQLQDLEDARKSRGKADPILAIEADGPVVLELASGTPVEITTQIVPAGIQRMGLPQFSARPNSGTDRKVDVDIAFLDTGVTLSHPDLNIFHAVSVVENDPDPGESKKDQGHGTHVAGILAARDNGFGVVGVAPGARLWSVRVASQNGVFWSDIIAGMDYVAEHADEIEVVNASVGSNGIDPTPSEAVAQAVRNIVNRGVVFVASAGNRAKELSGGDRTFGTSDDYYPAALREVMAVSAMEFPNETTGEGERIWYSSNKSGVLRTNNFVTSPGWAIDATAPGVDVISTYLNNGYAYASGTSMAAPHVAGLAALYISLYGKPRNAQEVYELRQRIVDTGQPQSEWGSPNTLDPDGHREPLALASDKCIYRGSRWRYWEQSSFPGPEWKTLDFDASAWRQGPSSLGFGSGDEATLISKSPARVTTYFRHEFNLVRANTINGAELHLRRGQGAVVYLNGAEIFRHQLPDGPITPETLASAGDPGEWVTNRISPAFFRAGQNVVAVETHLATADAPILRFNFELGLTFGQPAPELAVLPSSSPPTPYWPDTLGNFILQTTRDLTPPSVWSIVPGVPVLTNGLWQMAQSPGQTAPRFYRLKSMTPRTISGLTNLTVPVNGGLIQLPFAVSLAETDLDALNFTAQSLLPSHVANANIRIEGTGVNRTLTVMPNPDLPGSVPILVRLNDQGLTSIAIFTITITTDFVTVDPPSEPPATFKLVRSWEWNTSGNLEGWTANPQFVLAPDVPSLGFVSGQSAGEDPTWTSPGALGIGAGTQMIIEFRLRKESADPSRFDLFWADINRDFSPARLTSIPAATLPLDDQFHTVRILYFKRIAGSIDQIRLDPISDVPGMGHSVALDYFRIYEGP